MCQCERSERKLLLYIGLIFSSSEFSDIDTLFLVMMITSLFASLGTVHLFIFSLRELSDMMASTVVQFSGWNHLK